LLAAATLTSCAGVEAKPVAASDPQPAKEEIVTVEVEGLANVIPGNLLNTKQFSLEAAQRKAVEEALGVLITGQQVISQARLIEDQVFAKTAGYLKEWEVLSEREEDGVYITRIRAKVKLGDVRRDLDALGMLIQTKKVGNPRVMILIEEKINGESSEDRTVETRLAQQLLQRGYKIVDVDQLAEIHSQQVLLKALRGDAQEAAGLARRFGAEIALVGKANARKFGGGAEGSDPLMGAMISYRGSLNLKAVKASSGEMVLAFSEEGAGMDITEENAAIRCLATMAEKAGNLLAEELAPALWKGAEVQLAVSGVKDFGMLRSVVKSVRSADGVRNVVTRTFASEAGEAVFDVRLFGGNAQTLAANLDGRGTTPMEILEVAAYRIQASVARQEQGP